MLLYLFLKLFSVKNPEPETASFTYTVSAGEFSSCGSTFTKEKADSYVIGGSGGFDLGPNRQLDLPVLVRFNVPESASACTIVYNLQISGGLVTSATVIVTIQ